MTDYVVQAHDAAARLRRTNADGDLDAYAAAVAAAAAQCREALLYVAGYTAGASKALEAAERIGDGIGVADLFAAAAAVADCVEQQALRRAEWRDRQSGVEEHVAHRIRRDRD